MVILLAYTVVLQRKLARIVELIVGGDDEAVNDSSEVRLYRNDRHDISLSFFLIAFRQHSPSTYETRPQLETPHKWTIENNMFTSVTNDHAFDSMLAGTVDKVFVTFKPFCDLQYMICICIIRVGVAHH